MKSITQRPVILIAVIAAAVVTAAVLLSGGDDDGGSEPASGQAVPPAVPGESGGPAEQAEAADEKVKKAVAKQEAAAGVPEAGSEADSEDDSELSRDEIREKVKATVPSAQRLQFAQTAAVGVLQGFGYEVATTKVNKRDVVTVLIAPGSACAVELARIPEVKKKLFEVILFARKIRLQVLGYGGLNGYVAEHCKPLEVPSAPGQVLWSESGTGLKSSPQLQVTANRFTVAFANNGGSLEIYVTRGDQLIEPIIKSQTRETGTQTYAGPGIFRVTVSGSGSWAVKVYDGA